jgi:hypothetical protein
MGSLAVAQTTISLHTAQTTVQLQANATAPRLVSLQAEGLAPWFNESPEDLVASAEVDGHTVPLQWKLISGAGQASEERAIFIYETHSPPLRLTWEWSAPAATA